MTRNYFLIGFALLAAVLVATVIAYPYMPEMVPSHWNVHGTVDHYHPKWKLFITIPLGMLIFMGLFAILPWISPKHFEVDTFRSTSLYIMVVILAMFAYLDALVLWAGLRGPMDMTRSMICGLSLLVALLGNVLGKVRRNFYIGIRTPWTLANDTVWNATHRLGGKFFVLSGILGFVFAFLRGPIWLVAGTLALGAVVPAVYSLVFYKQLERHGKV